MGRILGKGNVTQQLVRLVLENRVHILVQLEEFCWPSRQVAFHSSVWGINLCASRLKQKCYRNLLLENNKRIEGFDSK